MSESDLVIDDAAKAKEPLVVEWTFKGKIWHHWELFDDEGVLVASLHSKRFFSLLFEGYSSGIPIKLRKSLGGNVTVTRSDTNELIGAFDRGLGFFPIRFHFEGGSELEFRSPSFATIESWSSEFNRVLSRTEFRNTESFHIGATLWVYESPNSDASPWLIAILSLYLAIATSYSNV